MQKNRFPILFLITFLFLIISCTQITERDQILEIGTDNPVKKWTFIIYMAADNNLETAAIRDINEIEAGMKDNREVNILVLIDRSRLYDQTNDNWSDTRLYKIKHDKNGLETVINSERIACPPLGIKADGVTELDLSDPVNLSGLIDFAKTEYPAEKYACFFWGHGSGWKYETNQESSNIPVSKAIAFDDESATFMSITDAAAAISGMNIDMTGFDTCFGALLEIVYEFGADSGFLAGSPGTIPDSGWDYFLLFDNFLATDFSSESLCISIINQFKSQYQSTPGSSISCFDLSQTETLRDSFESLMLSAADMVDTETECNTLRNLLLKEENLFHAESYPCDSYIDITRMTEIISSKFPDLEMKGNIVLSDINKAIPYYWTQDNESQKIAVHFIPLITEAIPYPCHNPGYVKNSGADNQTRFVKESSGWVPTQEIAGSFLDKLFYCGYP